MIRLARPGGPIGRLRAWCLSSCLLGLLAPSGGSPLEAQEPALPQDLQLTLLRKIVELDRKAYRFGDELILGVVFQPDNRESVAAMRELERAFASGAHDYAGPRRLRILPLPLDRSGLPDAVLHAQIVLVMPLRAVDVAEVIRRAGAGGSIIATGVEDYFRAGAAIALVQRDRRPRILIDLSAARLAGADFSAQLLRLSEVRQ